MGRFVWRSRKGWPGVRRRTAQFALAVLLASAAPSRAQDRPPVGVAPQPSIAGLFPESTGQSSRLWLAERGITYGLVHTTEVLSNVAGGLRRGAVFDGKLEAMLGIDFGRLAGLDGLTFYGNAFHLHGGGGPNRELIGGLNTVSNIEALPTTRLSELWFEQQFAGGQASLRAGQLVTDTEFLVSQYFGMFITSDWPTNPKTNIPSGGAAYPLATPGVRLKIDPTPQTTALLAVFNGDPAGPCGRDPELCNRHGVNFRVGDPPFVIGEVQYRYNQDAAARGLAGGVRLGAWHHFDRFDDLRFDANGLSLADPSSSGVARRLEGNSGVYGVIDQQLYRPQGADANSGVLAFARVAYSTPDRSLNDLYIDGGLIFQGLWAARPADGFGVSFLYAHVSERARGLDRDVRRFSGLATPLRDYELSLDFTYSAALAPGWTVQPNLQFVVHPGGHVPRIGAPTEPVRNAVIVGLRSTMRY